jgi:hypothetical protein
MSDRTRALDVIDRAIDSEPFCPVCGAPTVIHDDDGVISIRCLSLDEPHGLLGRLGAALMPHLQRELLDLRPGIAA